MPEPARVFPHLTGTPRQQTAVGDESCTGRRLDASSMIELNSGLMELSMALASLSGLLPLRCSWLRSHPTHRHQT